MRKNILLLVLILYSITISIGTLYLLLYFNKENTNLIKNYNLLEKCYEKVKLKSEISLQINCTNYNEAQGKCEGIYMNKTNFNYQDELEKCYELYK